MAIAALITWLITALGGFYMLGVWLTQGGHRKEGTTRFPAPVIFGHFLLAAAGLIVWIIYLATDNDALSWTAFIILLPVALLGFVMLARWIPTYRSGRTLGSAPAERKIPIAAVLGHGLFAVVTLVLVLLATLAD
jgi:hypothetical protein